MSRFENIIKHIITIIAVATGIAACMFFLQDLLPPETRRSDGAFGYYTLLVSDSVASVLAGVLTAWLVHFCLWDCLAAWLGNLWQWIHAMPRSGKGLDKARQA